jgi:putative phosphoribosyl transferase
MFEDRRDAGKRLAQALKKYKKKDVIVLAIPKGGVEVGYQVAKYLQADFSLIVTRKLPFPDNPESGFGALAEDWSTFIYEQFASFYPEQIIRKIIAEQKREIARRIDVLRKGGTLPQIKGKTVILIDDGIAMGSTMRASIKLCRNKGAKKIVVASPVAGREIAGEIGRMVDEVVILEKPVFFRAVAQVYRNWYDVSDQEVMEILEKWKKERRD